MRVIVTVRNGVTVHVCVAEPPAAVVALMVKVDGMSRPAGKTGPQESAPVELLIVAAGVVGPAVIEYVIGDPPVTVATAV
jgi:hypothetical protein